jgi:hypothetical protein
MEVIMCNANCFELTCGNAVFYIEDGKLFGQIIEPGKSHNNILICPNATAIISMKAQYGNTYHLTYLDIHTVKVMTLLLCHFQLEVVGPHRTTMY